MDESFLHFIWKTQKFSTGHLTTVSGESLKIFAVGQHNHDSGPDFTHARVKIGEMEWLGQVEIHVHASDWKRHGHGEDAAYDNVVLHVVWTADADIRQKDGTLIPVLELKNLVQPELLERYKKYLAEGGEVVCAGHLHRISDLIWHANLDRMLTTRLEEKARRILTLAEEYMFDWEEVAYITMARNFGFSLNADHFEQLARKTPLKILAKHADQPDQVLAVILGQAGFLDDPEDDYQCQLLTEYEFLKTKYQLAGLHRSHWKFGRMRPSNFPSVRLIQFASLMTSSPRLFSILSGINSSRELRQHFDFSFEGYWLNHYDFGKKLKRGTNKLGVSSTNNLIINSVAPLLAAYSAHSGRTEVMDKAVRFLEQLPPERNRFTAKFEELGKYPASSSDSQAMITLFRDFCARKKCLNCGIGSTLFSQ